MDEKFNAILSIALVPQTIALIAEKEGVWELAAMNVFYRSKVYDCLSREETKLWHCIPLTIYEMRKHEKETGELLFPEETE